MEFYPNTGTHSRHPLNTVFVILAIVVVIIAAWWMYSRIPKNNNQSAAMLSPEAMQYQQAFQALPEASPATNAQIADMYKAMNAAKAADAKMTSEARESDAAQKMQAVSNQ